MTRIILVRHGLAAAGFAEALDPPLDEVGARQAADAARNLAGLGPVDLIASPMRRTRETAAPLARLLGLTPRIEPRVSEIPSPGAEPAARGAWLRGVMASTWSSQPAELRNWRDGVVAALMELRRPTIVFTHFVAINAAVGAALGQEEVVVFRPDYCSQTVLDAEAGRLSLISQGAEAASKIL